MHIIHRCNDENQSGTLYGSYFQNLHLALLCWSNEKTKQKYSAVERGTFGNRKNNTAHTIDSR